MFDATPLTVEEITDQCRALAHAVIELENPEVKEILSFMLAERLESLHVALDAPYSCGDIADKGERGMSVVARQ